MLESCSSPVQHDVKLAARPQHSHPHHTHTHTRLPDRRRMRGAADETAGCTARVHVVHRCVMLAAVLHGDSKPETRPSAPSTIAHRPCHPATLPPCRFRAAIADLHLPRDAPNVRRACCNWKQQSAPGHRHHVSEITKTNPRVQCSRALAVLQPPSETRCLSCVHPCSC